MDFCGQKIKLWKPSGAVSDVTLRDLPAEGTFLAMQKEIRGLTAVGAGQVLAENVARESGQRIIGTKRKLRKVCAPESSPRASLAQRPVLKHSGWFLELLVGRGVVGNQAMFMAGLDVSQAFMNSPLERPEILRMPLHVSYEGRTNFSIG